MKSTATELRDIWNDATLPVLVRNVASQAATELSIARRRIAELEERTGQLADRLKDVRAAQAEPCHLLADLLDHVVGRDWTAVAPHQPWKAAIAYARRRPEEDDRG